MKVLFLTTYGVRINAEHFFTRSVIRHLGYYCKSHNSLELLCVTLIPSDDISTSLLLDEPELSEEFGVRYKTYTYPSSLSSEEADYTIAELFRAVSPDIIHSNMIEGMDVRAAKLTNIPIVLTIHIGGFICPRGGGNGLLRYDDTICDSGICDDCYKCIIRDLPAPKFGLATYRLFNNTSTAHYFANRKAPLWYLTTLFRTNLRIKDRQKCLIDYTYAHVIAANNRLAKVLKRSIPANHIHILPHGVAPRKRLPLPSLNGPVQFFILSRIQYSKGIIETLKAFHGIPHSQYKLHIIGDAGKSLSDRFYMKKVLIASRGINVVFHGRIPNTDIESVIEKCHIMIHSSFVHEIYGIAIAESLSMGRGVIATRCGGAEMQIQDGKNGILYEPHSIQALHMAILKILNNRNLIREFSESSELPMPIQNYITHLVALYHNVSGC